MCKLAGHITYGLKAAQSSSEQQPSTNRPVPCGQCQQSIPSYGMAQHYDAMHGGARNMGGTLENMVSRQPAPARAAGDDAAAHQEEGHATCVHRQELRLRPRREEDGW